MQRLGVSAIPQALVEEYVVSGDASEASRCLRELDVPYYHHELVKRVLVSSFDHAAKREGAEPLALLASLAGSGLVNQVRHHGNEDQFRGCQTGAKFLFRMSNRTNCILLILGPAVPP
jgi:MA3 domain